MDGINLDIVYQYIPTLFEGITAIIALFCYKYYKHTVFKYFLLVLWFVFFLELFGSYLKYTFKVNNWLYNSYNVVIFLYLYYIFYNYVHTYRFKKWILYSAVLFVLVAIINVFYASFIAEQQLLSYLVGASLVLFCIVLFFIEVLNTTRVLSITQSLIFWVSVGLLLFYVGYIPIKVTRALYGDIFVEFAALIYVHYALVAILNICYSIGFLWSRRRLQL